jgi:hypothetical protein
VRVGSNLAFIFTFLSQKNHKGGGGIFLCIIIVQARYKLNSCKNIKERKMKKYLVFMLSLLVVSLCCSCKKKDEPNAPTRALAQDTKNPSDSNSTSQSDDSSTSTPNSAGDPSAPIPDNLLTLKVGSELEILDVRAKEGSVILKLKLSGDSGVEKEVEVKLSASTNGIGIKMSEGIVFAKMNNEDVRVYVYKTNHGSFYFISFSVGIPDKMEDIVNSGNRISFNDKKSKPVISVLLSYDGYTVNSKSIKIISSNRGEVTYI